METGLTNETLAACLQSMKAMPSFAKYLLYKDVLNMFLPGKFMFDPIEDRFGWYRQVNGANFFISTKELLQAEKNSLFKLAASASFIISFSIDHRKFFRNVWKK